MRRVKRQSGFSLVEMMIVVVIIMVVAGMATPNVARGITVIRLRASASSVAGLLQRCRIEAVRTNRIMVVRQTLDSDGRTPVYFVDGAVHLLAGGVPESKQDNIRNQWEPMITTSRDFILESQANAPAFNVQQLLGYPNSILGLNAPFNLAFSQRGLPCTANSTNTSITSCPIVAAGAGGSTESSYQYFFRQRSTFGDRWASITVTPAGRVRVWIWNGTTWN